MTYEVVAHAHSGASVHQFTHGSARGAVSYMVENSRASFVDGYSVGGFGIVTIKTRDARPLFGWLDPEAVEFREGDADALLAAIEARGR